MSGHRFPGNQCPDRRFTGTRTKFEVDPKLDDRLFELPK